MRASNVRGHFHYCLGSRRRFLTPVGIPRTAYLRNGYCLLASPPSPPFGVGADVLAGRGVDAIEPILESTPFAAIQ